MESDDEAESDHLRNPNERTHLVEPFDLYDLVRRSCLGHFRFHVRRVGFASWLPDSVGGRPDEDEERKRPRGRNGKGDASELNGYRRRLRLGLVRFVEDECVEEGVGMGRGVEQRGDGFGFGSVGGGWDVFGVVDGRWDEGCGLGGE